MNSGTLKSQAVAINGSRLKTNESRDIHRSINNFDSHDLQPCGRNITSSPSGTHVAMAESQSPHLNTSSTFTDSHVHVREDTMETFGRTTSVEEALVLG